MIPYTLSFYIPIISFFKDIRKKETASISRARHSIKKRKWASQNFNTKNPSYTLGSSISAIKQIKTAGSNIEAIDKKVETISIAIFLLQENPEKDYTELSNYFSEKAYPSSEKISNDKSARENWKALDNTMYYLREFKLIQELIYEVKKLQKAS